MPNYTFQYFIFQGGLVPHISFYYKHLAKLQERHIVIKNMTLRIIRVLKRMLHLHIQYF